jgi:1,4-alpha-glucan branching enzyme
MINGFMLRDADVVLVLVSIVDAASYDFVKDIKDRVIKMKEKHPKPNSPKDFNTPYILWENKTDLENERVFSTDRAEALASELGFTLVRGSARNKEQTDIIFDRALRLCLEEKNKANNNNKRKSQHRECTTM